MLILVLSAEENYKGEKRKITVGKRAGEGGSFFKGENVARREKEQRREMRIFLQKGEISGGRSRRMEKKDHKNEICNIFTSGGSILDDCPGMKKLQ